MGLGTAIVYTHGLSRAQLGTLTGRFAAKKRLVDRILRQFSVTVLELFPGSAGA